MMNYYKKLQQIYPNYLLIICFIIIFLTMSMLKVCNGYNTFYDLGIYNHKFWLVTTYGTWGSMLYGHFQPILFIFLPFFELFSSEITLVLGQSILLLLPLIFIYKITNRSFRNTESQLVQWAYILYFPVWYAALFDFHPDSFAPIFFCLFYIFCLQKRWIFALTISFCLCFIKEVYAFITLGCGVYVCLHCKQYLIGVIISICGIFLFYLLTMLILPQFTFGEPGMLRVSAFSWLGENPFEMLKTICLNPFETIKNIITFQKITFITTLFLALLFIPLLSPIHLLPISFYCLVLLLSNNENHFGIGHHYTLPLVIPAIVSFIYGLPIARNFCTRFISEKIFIRLVFSGILIVHIMISPSPISRLFFTEKVWGLGWSTYISKNLDNDTIMKINTLIPDDPDIVVCAQNSITTDLLIHRKITLVFPEGVTTQHDFQDTVSGTTISVLADYVILDFERPLYLYDQGCRWKTADFADNMAILQDIPLEIDTLPWAKCLIPSQKKLFFDSVNSMVNNYDMIFAKKGLRIYKRKMLSNVKGI